MRSLFAKDIVTDKFYLLREPVGIDIKSNDGGCEGIVVEIGELMSQIWKTQIS
jgi:hypothetical protein